MILFLHQRASLLLQSFFLLFTMQLKIVIFEAKILLFLLELVFESLKPFSLHFKLPLFSFQFRCFTLHFERMAMLLDVVVHSCQSTQFLNLDLVRLFLFFQLPLMHIPHSADILLVNLIQPNSLLLHP
jgi:hypothetical protein